MGFAVGLVVMLSYHGTSVVGCGDGSEPLLACSVPGDGTQTQHSLQDTLKIKDRVCVDLASTRKNTFVYV